jgi:multiple sugar transport system permease protein
MAGTLARPDARSATEVQASHRAAWRSRYWRDSFSAYLFLLPFLAVYTLLLVFPFFKNIWISTYDWNLLQVAFNPEAKSFVGAGNYVRTTWGRNLTWDLANLWPLRLILLALAAVVAIAWRRGRLTGGTAIVGLVVTLGAALLLGFHPDQGGRWTDRSFWVAVRNTFVFVLFAVPIITAIALLLAVFLNHDSKPMAVLRTLFYMPSVLSVTVVTLIWWFSFSPYQGIVGNVTRALGGEPLVWLTDPNRAMPAIVIATVWWVIGFPMIVLLAGLQDIPKERMEAARLDGAGVWGIFRHITLPGLKRPLTFVVLYQVISQFQIFGQAHLMTRGGPGEATNTLVRYLYLTGFRDNELGRAAAMAFLLFCLMALASYLYLRMSARDEKEG